MTIAYFCIEAGSFDLISNEFLDAAGAVQTLDNDFLKAGGGLVTIFYTTIPTWPRAGDGHPRYFIATDRRIFEATDTRIFEA